MRLILGEPIPTKFGDGKGENNDISCQYFHFNSIRSTSIHVLFSSLRSPFTVSSPVGGHHHLLPPDQCQAHAQTGRSLAGHTLPPPTALHPTDLLSQIQWFHVAFQNMKVLLFRMVGARCQEAALLQ